MNAIIRIDALNDETFLDAAEVRRLTGWSKSATWRYFKSHAAFVTTQPARGGRGGVKELLRLGGLPAEFVERWKREQPEFRGHDPEFPKAGIPVMSPNSEIDRWPAAWREYGHRALAAIRGWREMLERFQGQPPDGKTLALERYAASIGISSATLRRWLNGYAATGCEGLKPGYGAKRGKHYALDERDRSLLEALFCNPDTPSVEAAAVFDAYLNRCRAAGREAASESTVRNFLNQERLLKRKQVLMYGLREVMNRTQPHLKRTRLENEIGEVYFSDHRQFDDACIWNDPSTGSGQASIVFPWATLIQDYRSGAITGRDINDGPNSGTIKTALSRAFRDWAVCKFFYTDNGKDFKAHSLTGGQRVETVRHLALDEKSFNAFYPRLDVEVIFAHPYNAQTKLIENWNKFMARRHDKGQVGYRGRNAVERVRTTDALIAKTRARIAEGQPVGLEYGTLPTRAEFEKQFDDFIAWHNARASQAEELQGQSPNQVWEANSHVPLKKLTNDQMRFLMMDGGANTVAKGGYLNVKIYGQKMTYYADELLLQHVGKKVFWRYHPDDLSLLYCSEPADDRAICVAVLETRVPGVGADETLKKAKLHELNRRRKLFRKHITEADALVEEMAETIQPWERMGMPDPSTVPPGPDLSQHPVELTHTEMEETAKEFGRMVANLTENQGTPASQVSPAFAEQRPGVPGFHEQMQRTFYRPAEEPVEANTLDITALYESTKRRKGR